MSSIPLVDLAVWRKGRDRERAAFAAQVDAAFREWGFVLVAGHGVPAEHATEVRAAASRAFALPGDVRDRYVTTVGGRGWMPIGKEANSYFGEDADPERFDLKETWVSGRADSTGDPVVDAEWFAPNVWPAEVPELGEVCTRYAAEMRAVYVELLEVLSVALGLDAGWFLARNRHPVETFNINRYPPQQEVGAARDGQFRIAPHTDWGTLTLLDRQPGYGGLQVEARDGSWVDAPHVPGALTVNAGDLLARWTGDRWRSSRHRVLPPPDRAPGEELISLILFFEPDTDALVESFAPPIGRGRAYEPVRSADYIRSRTAAATVA